MVVDHLDRLDADEIVGDHADLDVAVQGRLDVGGGEVPAFPGLALFLTIMAFNLIGDGIHVATNPQARRSQG